MKIKIKNTIYQPALMSILIFVLVVASSPIVVVANHTTGHSGSCSDDQITLSTPVRNDDGDLQWCLDKDGTGDDNPIFVYLRSIIRFLSAGVGIVAVGMIIVGGVQYAAARDNPQAIEGAKKKIANAVIGLILFMFMAAIMNFLIPGGIL